jgi:tRNA G18 (ribose-2'-O)-methylase SpoU
VAVENIEHDLNIGSIVRTANAFNVAGVHIVGRRRWNRRGAMVTDAYLDITHHPDPADLQAWAQSAGLPILAIDVVPGAVPIEGYEMPSSCILMFGQEGPGLSPEALASADAVLSISQYGSTRSINVAAAAAIAMHSWSRAHRAGGGSQQG